MRKLLMLFIIVFTVSLTGFAQIVVKIRPVAPVIVRSAAPSPRHVWIEGDWVGHGKGYQYVNGYWATPVRGSVWVPGHWKNTRRGWMWKPGHWRR